MTHANGRVGASHQDEHDSAPYLDGEMGVAYGTERLAATYDDDGSGEAYDEGIVVPFDGDPVGGVGPSSLVRPLPPRTWRERLEDTLAAAPVPGRMLAAAVIAAVLGVVAWRMLAPPPPPAEMELPFAEPAANAGTGEGGASPAGAPDPSGAGTAGATGPDGEPTAGADGEAGGEVVVHVAGAVATPGVRRLPAGARVIDGVDAAGGALPDADLARVNLAAALIDGQQVYIPRQGEVPPVPLPGAGAGGTDGPAGAGAGLVDVNSATADQLDELPGIGPTTADAIIAHRDEHGPFASVDDLLDVRGIGEAKLEQLRDLVTV